MAKFKIDAAEARDDGPWIRSEGRYWGQLVCHGVYLKHGLVAIAPNGYGPPDNYDYWSAMKVDFEGDKAEDSGPNRFSGTRDPIAVEIGRQWRAILDSGKRPKLGPIQLDPVKVASEHYTKHYSAELYAAPLHSVPAAVGRGKPPIEQEEAAAAVPHKYYSINDDTCLLIGVMPPGIADPDNLLARKWTIITAKGNLRSGHNMAGIYFIKGEVGAEEITAEQAGELAAMLGGSLEAAIAR
jgi:hypothetical protein